MPNKKNSASYGFAPDRRHAVRVAAQAERPYFDPTSYSQEDEMNARYGLPKSTRTGQANQTIPIERVPILRFEEWCRTNGNCMH